MFRRSLGLRRPARSFLNTATPTGVQSAGLFPNQRQAYLHISASQLRGRMPMGLSRQIYHPLYLPIGYAAANYAKPQNDLHRRPELLS
jgi:hypothetical protein